RAARSSLFPYTTLFRSGWTLNEYRLAPAPPDPAARKKRSTIRIPRVRDEAGLYRALDLDFIAPELRENCGEFDAAEKHSLPRLRSEEHTSELQSLRHLV